MNWHMLTDSCRRSSILSRRLLKLGSFTSIEDLKQRIVRFIDYFNQTMAKPFNCKYTGEKAWA